MKLIKAFLRDQGILSRSGFSNQDEWSEEDVRERIGSLFGREGTVVFAVDGSGDHHLLEQPSDILPLIPAKGIIGVYSAPQEIWDKYSPS